MELAPTDLRWIVVRAKPSQEEVAIRNIKRVKPHLKHYLPLFYDPIARAVRIMFRPYIFFEIEGGIWRFMDSCWGVAKIIRAADDFPYFVPPREIDKIKSYEDKEGVVQLGLKAWEVGQPVVITAGPLKFMCGKFVRGSQKGYCKVEISGMFGSSTMAEVKEGDLSKI